MFAALFSLADTMALCSFDVTSLLLDKRVFSYSTVYSETSFLWWTAASKHRNPNVCVCERETEWVHTILFFMCVLCVWVKLRVNSQTAGDHIYKKKNNNSNQLQPLVIRRGEHFPSYSTHCVSQQQLIETWVFSYRKQTEAAAAALMQTDVGRAEWLLS